MSCDLYAMKRLHDIYEAPFPGFPGSDLDFNGGYSSLDERRVQQFRARTGEPMPSYLGQSHQDTDAFLGSYRDFEVYQAGCYPHSDTRIQSARPSVGWVPGKLSSGQSPRTLLNYHGRGSMPYHTQGTSMQYAFANPDLY